MDIELVKKAQKAFEWYDKAVDNSIDYLNLEREEQQDAWNALDKLFESIARQSETEMVVCPVCGGSGVYQEYDEYDRYHVHACGKCGGTGNIARQSVKSEVDSRFGLPFFEYRPNAEYDRYYCGCYGWD